MNTYQHGNSGSEILRFFSLCFKNCAPLITPDFLKKKTELYKSTPHLQERRGTVSELSPVAD